MEILNTTNPVKVKLEEVEINTNNIKKEGKKSLSSFDKWLNKLIGDKQFLNELTDEEIYKIILKISEISFGRDSSVTNDHTYEDAAHNIYRNYKMRDYEKVYNTNIKYIEDKWKVDVMENDINTTYYREDKTGKYYKWEPRSKKKGFENMELQNYTVKRFTNLMFREFKNHINWHKRDKKTYNRLHNTMSIDYEDENMKFINIIEDKNNKIDKIEEELNMDTIKQSIEEAGVNKNYIIKIGDERLFLSYSNLMKLYAYLAEGKRVKSSEIIEHIIYKDGNKLNKEHTKYIGNFITSFKSYLLNTGIVNYSNYIDNSGKEKKQYGFN